MWSYAQRREKVNMPSEQIITDPIKINKALENNDIEEIKLLFREYMAELKGIDLSFQGFENELNSLPGYYSAPNGCLLIARFNETVAGCIALRKITDEICEMKRLFVKPEFRNYKIGKLLIDGIILEATSIGYQEMYLDSLPTMSKAIKLYESLGFQRINPYYFNPIEGTIYMSLKL
jgi:ribosomal protein S18 acetylase RimI-like enzyme